MSLTKLPLGRNNSVMTSLFPPRESLVVTSWLETGNSRTFFYGVCPRKWYCLISKNWLKGLYQPGSKGVFGWACLRKWTAYVYKSFIFACIKINMMLHKWLASRWDTAQQMNILPNGKLCAYCTEQPPRISLKYCCMVYNAPWRSRISCCTWNQNELLNQRTVSPQKVEWTAEPMNSVPIESRMNCWTNEQCSQGEAECTVLLHQWPVAHGEAEGASAPMTRFHGEAGCTTASMTSIPMGGGAECTTVPMNCTPMGKMNALLQQLSVSPRGRWIYGCNNEQYP
jgi:hypothetical protein